MPVDSKKILRVLHVGVGNRGIWPLEHCDADTGFAPASLCDVSEANLASARERTGLPESACFTDIDRAIARGGVDCMIVCAPTILHVPLAKKAIAARLPVMIEKGMAPDWASAQDLTATAQTHRAIVCVAQNYRYNPIERTVLSTILDPSHPAHVGAIQMVIYTQNRVRPVPRTLTYPFASVWDMSCHHFDTMLGWLGPMAAINANAWRASWSAYEHPSSNTTAHIEFARGAHAHYLHTHDAARANVDIQLHGERGVLVYDGTKLTFNQRPLDNFGSAPIVDVPCVRARGERDLLHDFHAYITQGIEPGVSVRNNLETMAACEMMVRSITQNRTVGREELN